MTGWVTQLVALMTAAKVNAVLARPRKSRRVVGDWTLEPRAPAKAFIQASKVGALVERVG